MDLAAVSTIKVSRIYIPSAATSINRALSLGHTALAFANISTFLSSNVSLQTEGRSWAPRLPSFYLYNLRGTEANETAFHKDCQVSLPAAFCSYLLEAPERVYEKSEAKLFLVPIFEASSSSRNSIEWMLEIMQRDRYFLKYRGSDFVFICYQDDCEDTVISVLDTLDEANRSIWVTRNVDITWMCKNRVIDLTHEAFILSQKKTLLMSEHHQEVYLISEALRKAEELIKGRNRWSCEGSARWDMKTEKIFDFGTIKDTSFVSHDSKVVYCGVPKVGSSVAVLLMRRMNGMPDWKADNTVAIRNFRTGYHWRLKDRESTLGIFEDTRWVKGALVRDPISRLLSGYRSKIEELKEYYRVPGGWHHRKAPTFSQFVYRIAQRKQHGGMDWMDRHIRPQSALCGFRTLPYDFIGRYEEREGDIRSFLESLELWDSLGASGWGENGTSSIYSQDEHIVRKKKLKPVTHADSKDIVRQYYTRELVKIVMRLYEEDFERFGFSKNVDDYV